MAKRGGQVGNQNGRTGKVWRDAIHKALTQYEMKDGEGKVVVKRGEALHKVANKLITAALCGDVSALKEFGDRLDGKPAQSIDLEASGKGGAPLFPSVSVVVDAMKGEK